VAIAAWDLPVRAGRREGDRAHCQAAAASLCFRPTFDGSEFGFLISGVSGIRRQAMIRAICRSCAAGSERSC